MLQGAVAGTHMAPRLLANIFLVVHQTQPPDRSQGEMTWHHKLYLVLYIFTCILVLSVNVVHLCASGNGTNWR